MLVAIENSCDETAIAIFDLDKLESKLSGVDYSQALIADVVSSQVKLHEAYGGVVPELAAREHQKNLPIVYAEALQRAGITTEAVKVVAATQGPGLKGCLSVGFCFSKALAFSRDIPLIPVHHIEGHIFAYELLQGKPSVESPILALVVSGGHTMLLLVKGFGDYQLLAETRDDAAGEAFDKIASLLHLPYPGGPNLSRVAMSGRGDAYHFPRSLPNDPASFSFSGLKTSVLQTLQKIGEGVSDPTVQADLAASAEQAIVDSLVSKTVFALQQCEAKLVVLSGGVAANRLLRQNLKLAVESCGRAFLVPELRYCTDNAAMIGVVAHKKLVSKVGEGSHLSGENLALHFASRDWLGSGVMPRWPLAIREAAAN